MRRLKLHSRYSILPSEQGGCWIWLRGFDVRGYPQPIYYKGKNIVPYKVLYQEEYGISLEGKEIDHTCRNRRCVNPEHLEIVTHTTNIRRRSITKLSMPQAREIRELYSKGTGQNLLARLYGVTQSVISEIVNNKAWQEDMEVVNA